MQIGKDKVVSIHYRLSEPDGTLLEDSHASEPLVYLHGHDGMLHGVESALDGKQAGDHVSVTLAPEQAYGQRIDGAIQRVSKSHVIGAGKNQVFRPGMLVQVNTSSGPRSVVVVKAGLKTLDVDTNHPLAGMTLRFDIDVVAVRDASREELAHGHVHGDGGVHH